MNDHSSKNANRPFKNLKSLLKRRNIPLTPRRMDHSPAQNKAPGPPPQKDSDLFTKAMADVNPIAFNKIAATSKPSSPSAARYRNEEHDAMTALHMLISEGHGFIVSQTPEYMESANPGVSSEILRRLHQGHYAIQDFIDLHGFRGT